MHIGILTISLFLHDTRSLKDRRSVSKNLQHLLRSKFNISIAEVPGDKFSSLQLDIAFVNSNSAHCDKVLDAILNHVKSYRKQIQLEDYQRQIL